jgi:hypothetical protein
MEHTLTASKNLPALFNQIARDAQKLRQAALEAERKTIETRYQAALRGKPMPITL